VSNDQPFEPPEVLDADILWASSLISLCHDAFLGDNRVDRRQDVLKSMANLDVAACPGSGKTTLLVAKLAILARKWQYRTRGICVISHTNAARNEIEMSVGNTTVGQRLLSYPHYVGTIHGFVNEYFARPWLRSRGYPIKMIDTEICERRRWLKLERKYRFSLEKKNLDQSSIRIIDTSFNLAKKDGKFPFADDTSTYKELRKACQETAREGYHCYDDMFIWGCDVMDKVPGIVDVIRDRFPLLFVDEAQDNSEEQSSILHRIFMKGSSAVIRQRFGDENQAIFDSMVAKEATKDKFPDGAIKIDLPNSHRFGQKIATLVDPLGIVEYPCGLKGQGPKKSRTSEARHTMFLFGHDSAEKVFDAYGALLIETFTEQELADGRFTAVGQVHRQPDAEANHKFPHHICHYWPDYDSQLTSLDPKPKTFAQYISVGMGKAETVREAYPLVERIADGILRLSGMVEGRKTLPHRIHSHRYILKLLKECTDLRRCYEDLIAQFAVKREVLTKEIWDSDCSGVVRNIAETIAGASLSSPEANGFLAWKDALDSPDAISVAQLSQDN
jgi:DNA helicase II / ATP-dependent DNA helicase PcrA